jgi:hypothetical protein
MALGVRCRECAAARDNAAVRLTALLILVVSVTACGSQRAVEAPVTVTVTKTGPSPVSAKPTGADRVAIRRAVHAAACPRGDKCEISNILFARSDLSYVRASVYDPKIGGALAVLHKGTRWKVIGLGSSDIGCDNTPRRVRSELELVCTGDSSGGQQAAPPPTATVSEFSPSDPYNGRPGDKHFAVYYLQVKDDGLGDIGGIARVKNVGSTSLSGTFTFTFFQGGKIVGTALGSAQEVSPGQTVTVQLVSQDNMFAGRFRYQFQVDIEF